MVPGMKGLSYLERTKQLGLWTLEERRNRADILEVYKMARGLSRLQFSAFFDLDSSHRTRGHVLKLVKRGCDTDLRRHFFSERVFQRWNGLDDDTVSAESLNSFKNRLSKLRDTRMGLFKD